MKGVIKLLSGKYHMGSLIAIFFALGIGILIGGSLGQKWMFQTEQHTLRILMDKYEGKLEENQKLHKDMNALQLMQRTVAPLLEHKRILWVRPHSLENDMLAQMMISAGVDWVETEAATWLGGVDHVNGVDAVDAVTDVSGIETPPVDTVQTDMIIISDPQQIDLITRLRAQLEEGDMDGYTKKATSSPQSIDHHTSVE
ncbi:MAG: copper transporter [Paenibacillaceae bacterium]